MSTMLLVIDLLAIFVAVRLLLGLMQAERSRRQHIFLTNWQAQQEVLKQALAERKALEAMNDVQMPAEDAGKAGKPAKAA